jgi:hypothetical protein
MLDTILSLYKVLEITQPCQEQQLPCHTNELSPLYRGRNVLETSTIYAVKAGYVDKYFTEIFKMDAKRGVIQQPWI